METAVPATRTVHRQVRASSSTSSTTNGTRSPRGAWTTPRSPARSRRRGASTARICGAHRGHRRRSA
ncbi:hypothetical protein QP445_10305 [Micrococcus luteus]|nr:hypothetical protein [Micrococcus luteus]